MTLTEVMLVTAMIGIMSTAMASLIVTVQRSYGSYEAQAGIQLAAQSSLNRMMSTMIQSKKIFDASADAAWLGAIQNAGAPRGGPAIMTNSKLPTIEPNGSFAPSTTTFVQAGVGDELFFLSIDTPTSMSVTNSLGVSEPVMIDAEHFNLYYLAFNATPGVVGFGGVQQIVLQEWHGIPFADYEELANLGDGVLTTNAAAYMYAHGYRYAIDTATATAASGLYTITALGAIVPAATTAGFVPLASTKPMINILTGVSGFGYKYGVSPNTSTSFSHIYPVPVFAAASGNFPAGFETMIIGANSARQIFIRLVLVASGPFKGYKATGQTVSATVRDLY